MEIIAPDKRILQKDLLILAHLRQNARETLTSLSKKTRIPISTIYDRLKANENCLIKKHTCLLDYQMLGFNTRANVVIKVGKRQKDAFRDMVVGMDNINSVYKINNGYDFLIDVIFRNIKELESFLERLDDKFTIKSRQVFHVIEDLKTECFMSYPELVS
ncbi:Lrp/AsnC family transcriptional regulator [Candidatus Woesearchaeota archaeon]|nr:Lrp/AsnC family transcriptional regulator [Candidatus Woesearchaeota archaeon]